MREMIILVFIFLLNLNVYQACNVKFDRLDPLNTTRYVFEQDIFNVTGQLQNCPSFLSIRNISVENRYLRRLSILNVSYFIETNRIHITALPRLIGFAPLDIELYFEKSDQYK